MCTHIHTWVGGSGVQHDLQSKTMIKMIIFLKVLFNNFDKYYSVTTYKYYIHLLFLPELCLLPMFIIANKRY